MGAYFHVKYNQVGKKPWEAFKVGQYQLIVCRYLTLMKIDSIIHISLYIHI